jgi:hypothetical protein
MWSAFTPLFSQKEAKGLVQATHWHFTIDILSIYLTACQVPIRFVSCSPFDLTLVGYVSLISRKTPCFQFFFRWSCNLFTPTNYNRKAVYRLISWNSSSTRDYITISGISESWCRCTQYHGKCLVTYICLCVCFFFFFVSVFQHKRNPSFLTWAPVLRHIVLEKCLST